MTTINSKSQGTITARHVAEMQGRGAIINPPTKEENEAALDEFFAEQRRMKAERSEAVKSAIPALERLLETFPQRTGQSYKIRSLLYSLWNGKAASLSDVLNLDWDLRKDLCAVILAFGYEDREHEFFYDAISGPLKSSGNFKWFLEAGESEVTA